MSELVAPGVWRTAAGTVSRSEWQTAQTVEQARRLLRYYTEAPHLADDLTDEDLRWLLVMGWDPREQRMPPTARHAQPRR